MKEPNWIEHTIENELILNDCIKMNELIHFFLEAIYFSCHVRDINPILTKIFFFFFSLKQHEKQHNQFE